MARIRDLLAVQRTVSFEFFPPKTAAQATQLSATIDQLQQVDPDFVSVTYGAAGSDRQYTVDTVQDITANRRLPTLAHLTCAGHTKAEIVDICDRYAAIGVENLLAVRGDPRSDHERESSDFRHASDLVEFLRNDGRFGIGVAAHPDGHPESADVTDDRRRLAEKLTTADFGITQFFFEIETYLEMMNELSDLGCDTPVIPGVIPITDARQVARFAALAGTTLPAWLRVRIEQAGSAEEVSRIGIDVARQLADDLLTAGAPGLHLYTLNRAEPSLAVLAGLRSASR